MAEWRPGDYRCVKTPSTGVNSPLQTFFALQAEKPPDWQLAQETFKIKWGGGGGGYIIATPANTAAFRR
jgi:hypothetical protein